MTGDTEAFQQRILARSKDLADELSNKRLSVAVLGPNLDESNGVGTKKRNQIADSLKNDGHKTFFPECLMDRNDPDWIEQERKLLADSSVDFVVILHTETSAGVLVEIGNFVSVPEISSKTGILFPFRFYEPMQNLAANTVQAYPTKFQYTDDQMTSCELVAECRQWIRTRQKETSLQLKSESF